MKVLLLNIDSKLPNIALHKIAMWHELQGDEISWDALHFYGVDKVYGSCILTKSRERPRKNLNQRFVSDYLGRDVTWGGTGYDFSIKLPPEIEEMRPKLNYGFTTRGCIRHCKFCLVPRAEGNIHIVGDIYDVWDGESSSIVLYDNNILALPDHFEMICRQLQKENISVDFNQALDIRLVTPRICELLEMIKLKNELRFSFDSPKLEGVIRKKVALIKEYHIRKCIFFFVLVGFDTSFEEDMHRLDVIKELGGRAYVMRHENTPKEKRYIRMAQWTNQFFTFAKYDFETFCVEYEKK